MNQTNIHLFTTRTNGKYKGLLEGTAQWFENLERFNMMKTLSDTFKLDYHNMRVPQLKELDNDTLINDLVLYELELLDHADRLLSDETLPLDSKHGFETVELLGDEVINLVKTLDTDKQFNGIHDYIIGG
ncbi:hypothetical protein K6V07_08175 [Streptococcus uberis]|uniref:hypothetical protein n=2 Tax=Streptococcus uberis TaxID=1349 RepID=UPI001C98B934|nr:hypothetical protein [Streptococcus uberis]